MIGDGSGVDEEILNILFKVGRFLKFTNINMVSFALDTTVLWNFVENKGSKIKFMKLKLNWMRRSGVSMGLKMTDLGVIFLCQSGRIKDPYKKKICQADRMKKM